MRWLGGVHLLAKRLHERKVGRCQTKIPADCLKRVTRADTLRI